VGLYLLWPAFYNDVTDSYRLSRRGRLRADLGGVYFNRVFVVAVAAVYGLTGFEPLLVVIVLQHLAVLEQFLPFLRLDGYYVVSDLVGVRTSSGASSRCSPGSPGALVGAWPT
jgi:putative peptide zinc metalloprotease protein